MNTELKLKQLVHNYFDAWNRGDAAAAAGYFADDAVYIDTALGNEYRGNEIESYIAEEIAGDYRLEVSVNEDPVIKSDTVFLQSVIKITANGQDHLLESAELIKVRDDKIVMTQTYYNIDEFLTELEKDNDKSKYAKSGLNQEQTNEIKQRLDQLMKDEEPFRNSELKLQDLAELLSISRNHLSQILNSEYQMKYFDFINHYRLQVFLKTLHATEEADINVAELAYAAGFSSSSVFYKVFKRYQEISPRQYIKNIKQNPSE